MNNAHDFSIGFGKRGAPIGAVWASDFLSRKASRRRMADACGWSPRWVQAACFILRCRWRGDDFTGIGPCLVTLAYASTPRRPLRLELCHERLVRRRADCRNESAARSQGKLARLRAVSLRLRRQGTR